MDYSRNESVVISTALQELLAKYQSKEMILMHFKSGLLDWVTGALDPKTQDNLSNKYLKRRTGALAQSAKWVVRKYLSGFKLIAESGTPYGAIQEHGGTVVPVHAKYLTIPLSPALTSAGVLRKPAREWGNTFIQKSKAGNLIIFQNRGKKIVPLFLLRKQVKIPASHWASKAVEETQDQVVPYIMRRFPV